MTPERGGESSVPQGSEADTRRPGRWWLRLTSHEAKYRLYSIESYFREGWLDACDILEGDKFMILQRTAVVMFKPEAVVSRKIGPALELLRRHEFVPMMARRFRLNRHTAREMWRYQWDAATLDRLALSDLLITATDSLWVALRDASRSPWLPASVRLAGLKGSPQPHERRPEDLRAQLASPNRMLTFLHVADEPADTVRELGILFSRGERRRLLSELRAGFDQDGSEAVLAMAAELEQCHPRVELDVGSARERLQRRIEDGKPPPTESRPRIWLQQQLEKASAGRLIPWLAFLDALEKAGIEADPWDLILLGSAAITHDEEGRPCTLDGDTCMEGWRRGEAVLLV